MRNNLTTALNGMALAALLVFSLSAHSAPAKRALVYPSGRVSVDGKAVKTVTTLFPGDQVATARRCNGCHRLPGLHDCCSIKFSFRVRASSIHRTRPPGCGRVFPLQARS